MAADMVTAGSTKLRKLRLIAVIGLLPACAVAADVKMGVSAAVSYLDNVFLATSPNETADTVYQASPWIDILHESPRLDAVLNYRYDYYRYSDLDTSSSFHSGIASLTAKAWQDSLKFEVGARRRQVLNSPDFIIPSGRLPLSNSLVDRDEVWINPRFERNLGGTATVNANYRRVVSRYGDESVSGDTSQRGLFSIDNYRAGLGLTWAVRYDWRRTEYETAIPWEYQQAKAEVGFWVSKSLRFFGSAGKESDHNRPLDPSLQSSLWEAGFSYSTAKVSAEFAAGERSFGSTFRGKLDYKFRRGSTTLRYSEEPASIGFNRSILFHLGNLDPGDIGDYLNSPGSTERFVIKRLQWDLDVDLRRTGIKLIAFDETRSGRFASDGTPLDDQSQSGVKATATWKPGVRTSFTLTGAIVNRDSTSSNKSQFSRAGLAIGYALSSRSILTLSYDHSEQQPKGDSSTSRDYVSSMVSLLFDFTFL